MPSRQVDDNLRVAAARGLVAAMDTTASHASAPLVEPNQHVRMNLLRFLDEPDTLVRIISPRR
jgi:hypothetical protein